MNCPNCNHSAQAGHIRCTCCNYKLPETEAAAPMVAATTKPCWNCAHPNALDAARCAQCNARPKTVLQPLMVAAPKRPAVRAAAAQ